MDAQPFIDGGVYDPAAPRAAERWELLEHLVGRGVPVERIIEAASRGWLTDLAASHTHQAPDRISLAQVARRCQANVEEVALFRAALGFPPKDPGGVPETFCDDFALCRMAADQFGVEPTLDFARQVGASVARLMEGGRALFTSPLRGTQPTELQISQANELALAAWYELAELIRHLMIEWAARDVQFELDLLQGDVTVGIAFVDLVDSTAWAASVSASDHAGTVARFEALATEVALSQGARTVKFIGDEVMIAAPHAVAAVEAAVQLCERVDQDRDLPRARGAVGYGPVKARTGDYFGEVVNLVARSTKVARPGEVVISQSVIEHLDTDRWRVGAEEPTLLKGVSRPTALFRITRTRDR